MKNILPLSYIELSKKNLIHNIKQFRILAKRGTKLSVAIKGNAYGHEQNEVAKILEPHVDYFQVDSVEELKLLRKVSKKTTLLLGYVQESDLSDLVKLKCVLSVYSIKQVKKLNQVAKKLKVKQEIHLPVDAHLGREGILPSELPNFLKKLKRNTRVKLSGVYAHFANIEDTTDFSHAEKQIVEYEKALRLIKNFGFRDLETHISATSGLLVYEKSTGIHPLVRLGIGVYGMWPSEHIQALYKNKITLKPVLSWKTKVAQIKVLPKGHTIGYGLTYKTKKETKVAVIPQGYADGIDRKLSNKGVVLIRGAKCQILGRVMMNMFLVNVSHIKTIKPEDEVVIIGTQSKKTITAEDIAKKLNTINYEIITRINPLLPRRIN